MLVESPDGHRALLGRSAKSTPGMYTCLSGFIDPCEGIEEAVRREVMEEARVQVGRLPEGGGGGRQCRRQAGEGEQAHLPAQCQC